MFCICFDHPLLGRVGEIIDVSVFFWRRSVLVIPHEREMGHGHKPFPRWKERSGHTNHAMSPSLYPKQSPTYILAQWSYKLSHMLGGGSRTFPLTRPNPRSTLMREVFSLALNSSTWNCSALLHLVSPSCRHFYLHYSRSCAFLSPFFQICGLKSWRLLEFFICVFGHFSRQFKAFSVRFRGAEKVVVD